MTELGFVFLWAKAFGLTLFVELGLAVPLLARTGASFWQRCVLVGLAQFATHPVVWFVIPAFHLPRAAFVVVAELWAVVAEAAFYAAAVPRTTPARAVVVSVVANTASVIAGVVARTALAT